MRFANKVAVVTGACQGMGAAIAKTLVEEGAQVFGIDLPAKLPDEGREIPARLAFVGADLGRKDNIEAAINRICTLTDRVDILVNNAGIIGVTDASIFGTEENWRQVMDVNLDAVWRMSRLLCPCLIASGHGRIVNIGSVNSEYPAHGFGAYATSKHAVFGLTKNLAIELGAHGITVNAVFPGATDTPLSRGIGQFDKWRSHFIARSPLARLGSPEDIAAAVAFLASDAASFITGAGLYVDGGMHLQL